MEHECRCCRQVLSKCICPKVDKFFEKAKGVPRAGETSRCLACFFDPCVCASGLDEKKIA